MEVIYLLLIPLISSLIYLAYAMISIHNEKKLKDVKTD